MTKQQRTDRQEAIDQLRQWIKPGDTVYTILEHVSRSGMSRSIRVVLLKHADAVWNGCKLHDEDGSDCEHVVDLHPNHAVAVALGLRRSKREGVIVGGCGMDMGFHLVYELSHTIYPEYACLGKGKCPSNYHVNYRRSISCQGGEDATGETVPCFRGDDGLYRLRTGVGEHFGVGEVCPTCKGKGEYSNPDGEQRFDLVHTDGYCLRQRWL